MVARWRALGPWFDDRSTACDGADGRRRRPRAGRAGGRAADLARSPWPTTTCPCSRRSRDRPDWSGASEAFERTSAPRSATSSAGAGALPAVIATRSCRSPGPTIGRASSTCRAAARRTSRLIELHTSLPLTADEVHAIGLEEVERIDADLAVLGERVLGTSDLADDPAPAPRRPGDALRDPRRGPRDGGGVLARARRRRPGLVRHPAEGRLRRHDDGRARGEALDHRLLPPACDRRLAARPVRTSTPRSPRPGRATRPRRSRSTRRSPATTSRSRSARS